MVKPTDQSFSTVFFPYPRDITRRTWNPHPNPISSPPPTIYPNSTTINTSNSHTKNPKECTGNPQPNSTLPKKKKNNAEQQKKKKKKLKPKIGAPTHLSHDLEVHVSHDLTWVQSNVVSRIPYHRRSFWSQGLVLLSFWCHKKKRRRALGQWEKRALGKRKKNEEGEETEKNQERDVTWWDKSYEWVPFFA